MDILTIFDIEFLITVTLSMYVCKKPLEASKKKLKVDSDNNIIMFRTEDKFDFEVHNMIIKTKY